jgi:hypothetical protein
MIFHPQYDGVANKLAYSVNDGGVFRTADATAATDTTGTCKDDGQYLGAVKWSKVNNHLTANQFVFGSVYADGSGYLGGVWDNSTVWGSNTAGVDGRTVHEGARWAAGLQCAHAWRPPIENTSQVVTAAAERPPSR